jgi:hypothetical protein
MEVHRSSFREFGSDNRQLSAPAATSRGCSREAQRALAIDFRPEALEAERVIAIRANFTAVAEERAARSARRALMLGFTGVTAAIGWGHATPLLRGMARLPPSLSATAAKESLALLPRPRPQ